MKSSSGLLLFLLAAAISLEAAQLKEARVTEVIRDVKIIGGTAPKAATISDNVREGMGVRTGLDSRAELTFSDLTITRLGENTVFSFNESRREVTLDSGALLLQVPKGGAAARINSAVATATISGGTGMYESNKGFPEKLLVLEGQGIFCSKEHPEQCETVHAGEMATMGLNGEITKPQKFNIKKVVESAKLLKDFPPLPNMDLILLAIEEQQLQDVSSPPENPPKDPVDIVDQHEAALPPVTTSPPPEGPSKFGPPSTITSPDPYVINSTTQIQTDPTITTNGVTDQGKLYRGTAVDGPPIQYLFGEAPTAFDQLVINGPTDHVPIAVFKFAHLQLAGDPTVSVAGGGAINLALVSVGDITSSGPGGTLTFAGIDRLTILTQAGSINLGPEIAFAFANLSHLELYARGAGSNLTMGSAISNIDVVKLYAEGSVQVNGDVSTTDFTVIAGGDYLFGSGIINTTNVDIQALGNVNIDSNQFPDFTGDANAAAGNTLSITLSGGGGPFSGNSLTGTGATINLQGSGTPHTFNLGNADVSFVAGSGGIQAPNILFTNGNSLVLQATNGGDINIYGFVSPPNGNGGHVGNGMIDAAGAINATTDITNTQDLTAGTSVSVGGDLGADTVTAGTTIHVGGNIYADTLSAGGNIDASGIKIITINAPTSVLTVGGNDIIPVARGPEGAARQHTFNVDSIVSSGDIDFSGNQFNGIGGLSSGGRLTINANHIAFNPADGIASANFNGADAGAFGGGNPAEGGDGGIFIVNTAGDISADIRADITATTGMNTDISVYSGAGGSVTLNSSGGTVSVDNTIQVSSDDAGIPSRPGQGGPGRESASGGNINLTSNSPSGVAISVTNSGQLLSLLNGAAPGPGGTITILASGASSEADISGTVRADRGTIDIRQTGDDGSIALGGPPIPGGPLGGQPGDFISMHADIIKIGALGTNGTLTIGAGTISADTTLQLYAGGSNGLLHFVADVTLSSGSAMHLAANTIRIDPGFTVTINGDGGAANVYTNHPDYNFTPGPGYTGPPGNPNNGSFGGNGAHDPQPLPSAPPFDPPRHGRGH